ncbi:MAG: hypothetical protein K2J11_10415 [Oscillospiraceae bacterium]|nr:hypothetical protein [Oscillospiraceae bacterium]
MIDKSKKYWTGDSADDISEYLRLYSEDDNIDVKPVICHSCGNDSFELRVDQNEDVIQVKCTNCGTKKILLDCDEFWEDARPRLRKCPICKSCKSYNVSVGFTRRENGSVKWVYIGNRCTNCGTLGSYLDWKIDYEPTDEMEQNI